MTDVARKECVCHRTSARNCPVHQNYVTDVAPETDVEALARRDDYSRKTGCDCHEDESLRAQDPDYSPAYQDEYQRLWHEAQAKLLRAEEERDEGTSLGFILRENHALRRAASQVLHEYDLWAEDANDGEFAIWSRDEFMASFMRLRAALATPEETKEAEEAG